MERDDGETNEPTIVIGAMNILDKYILKRYLVTFFVMLLLFIPIGIIIDISEKVNKLIENKVPLLPIVIYYYDFTIYFANLLFPIFLFLSIIWFTSKMANNTEIIAILSSGISFTRFLRPYFIGATLVCVLSFFLGISLLPKSSEGFQNFRYTYLVGDGRQQMRDETDVYRQISADEFIYVSNFNPVSKTAFNFSLEKFKGEKLVYKITANRLKFNPLDSTYTMFGYVKRTVGTYNDVIDRADQKIAKFSFDLEDLTPTIYVAETLPLGELQRFIEREKKRGNSNVNAYYVVLYKKFSNPVSAFILTIIAVAVSSMKRRGGMGVNLSIGILLAFSFIFLDKIFGVLGDKSSISPLLAVWVPNLSFGALAVYLLRNAIR